MCYPTHPSSPVHYCALYPTSTTDVSSRGLCALTDNALAKRLGSTPQLARRAPGRTFEMGCGTLEIKSHALLPREEQQSALSEARRYEEVVPELRPTPRAKLKPGRGQLGPQQRHLSSYTQSAQRWRHTWVSRIFKNLIWSVRLANVEVQVLPSISFRGASDRLPTIHSAAVCPARAHDHETALGQAASRSGHSDARLRLSYTHRPASSTLKASSRREYRFSAGMTRCIHPSGLCAPLVKILSSKKVRFRLDGWSSIWMKIWPSVAVLTLTLPLPLSSSLTRPSGTYH